MSERKILALLEKTSNFDKDERYMALSDLCQEVQKEATLDVSIERRICNAILERLQKDTSNDVQSIAVKCLSIVVGRVHENQVAEICEQLCGHVLEGRDELRDIYSIGLKTLINDVPSTVGHVVARRTTVPLLRGVQQDGNDDLRLECLDILGELLKRFGRDTESEHASLAPTLQAQLYHTRNAIRKRASLCLGQLAVALSDEHLQSLLQGMLHAIEQRASNANDVRTTIQALGTISRHVGYRLGRNLQHILPMLMRFMGAVSDESLANEQGHELRENALQALESFVLRCPRQVTEFIPAIVSLVRDFVQFDPNYTYDEEEDGMGDGAEMDDELDDMGYDDVGNFSDDDDTSWKVRRAAVKVLAAIVETRPEMLRDLYDQCADVLIMRFKEREENVRLDVISAFTSLLRATVVSSASRVQAGRTLAKPKLVRQRSTVAALHERVPAIIDAASRQLRSASVKTKTEVFTMLRELTHVLCRGGAEGLQEHMRVLLTAIKEATADRTATLRLEALLFLHALLESHAPEVFHPHMDELVAAAASSQSDDWYKTVAECVRLAGVLARTARPIREGVLDGSFDFAPVAEKLFAVVLPRLRAHDIDQEVKESAIGTIGVLVATFGDVQSDSLPDIMAVLRERLRNETTRTESLKALSEIARSPLRLSLGEFITPMLADLTSFLRQSSRALRQAALESLVAIMRNETIHRGLDLASMRQMLAESALLIGDQDLHLSHYAIVLCISVLRARGGEVSPPIRANVLPQSLELARSPLLQGAALHDVRELLAELVRSNFDGMTFNDLLDQLLQPALKRADLPKSAMANVARCVASLAVAAPETERDSTVDRFLGQVRSSSTESEFQEQLALLCLGEIGRLVDLSHHGPVHEVVLGAFHAPSEDVKAAASVALGQIAAGNLSEHLPFLLSQLASTDQRYLILAVLKESISADDRGQFAERVDDVLHALRGHCGSEEEGIRNMVAECYGRLCVARPDVLVPALVSMLDAAEPPVRCTAVTSLKYFVSAHNVAAAAMVVEPHMRRFFHTLTDESLDVRRAALQSLTATVHHQHALVRPLFYPDGDQGLFPHLYSEMRVKEELKRTVDLGPFKHRIDDGLPLRKAAVACIDTFLDMLPERVNVDTLVEHLSTSLRDTDDIRQSAHLIVTKLVAGWPGHVAAHLDAILTPITTTLREKVKAKAGQDDETLRSGIRAILACGRVQDIVTARRFHETMELLAADDVLRTALMAIQSEQHGVPG